MPNAHGMHISQMPQACCMCPTCMPMQGACTQHTHHFTCHTHTHACDIHPAHTLQAHTKHIIHMSQTCLMYAAHALHTCHSLAIFRLNTFHMRTFMHAQAYYMQERHKLAAHTLYAHNVCVLHVNNTQAAHMPHSPASQMPHMIHAQVCCSHAKDTHCVHVACKLYATHACMPATLILQCNYFASTLMSCIMQICTYTACMHIIPT
jgi:hypothetical protein